MGIQPKTIMKMKITLTEDQVLEMLADFLTKKLGRIVDPEHIEELESECDTEDYISCIVETDNLGPTAHAA